MSQIITVPLIPPSNNHYKKYRVIGRYVSWYLTREAKAFRAAVAIAANGVTLKSKFYAIKIHVFLGKGDRQDLDNSPKQILDSLVEANVIHSDSAIDELYLLRSRDRSNPRTEITIIAR